MRLLMSQPGHSPSPALCVKRYAEHERQSDAPYLLRFKGDALQCGVTLGAHANTAMRKSRSLETSFEVGVKTKRCSERCSGNRAKTGVLAPGDCSSLGWAAGSRGPNTSTRESPWSKNREHAAGLDFQLCKRNRTTGRCRHQLTGRVGFLGSGMAVTTRRT